MAAFVTRTLDQSLLRGGRRAALAQWWNSTPHYDLGIGMTTVGNFPAHLQSDGADVWVANGDNTVSRVRGSDGKLLETWTDAPEPVRVLVAMGRIFLTGSAAPGKLYMIDPSQTAGPVTNVTVSLGDNPWGIAFDGNRIWTANTGGAAGSVSIVTPGLTAPWSVTTVTAGLVTPIGALFDGSNIWVTDEGDNTIKRLNSDGSVAQTVSVGLAPQFPVFDGHNIWVPNLNFNSVTVVRASDGTVLKSLDGNGLNGPLTAAFDGRRVMIINSAGGLLSLFDAATISPIGTFSASGGFGPNGVCSDGTNFWISFSGSRAIGRF